MRWRSIRSKPDDVLNFGQWRDYHIAREIYAAIQREHYDDIIFSLGPLSFHYSQRLLPEDSDIHFLGSVTKESKTLYDNINLSITLHHQGNRDYKVLSDGLPYTLLSRFNGKEGLEFVFKPSFQRYQGGNSLRLLHISQYHLRDYMKPNDKMVNIAQSLEIPETDGIFHLGSFNLLTRAIEPSPGTFMKNYVMLASVNAGFRRYSDFPDLVREAAAPESTPEEKPKRRKRRRRRPKSPERPETV